ncbi:MAG: hypothetical protein PHQ95_00535 [Candidatus Gracilibacteria bacterium]|nr:hypothetical protein [Candidatus Gracilibacteria bacterium]
MRTITQFYNKCPDCICKRTVLLKDDPIGEVYKPLLLVGLSLKKLVASLKTVTTEEDFSKMRQELETQYGIRFLIQGTGGIQVYKDTPGLCKRSRENIQNKLNSIIDKELAAQVLMKQTVEELYQE